MRGVFFSRIYVADLCRDSVFEYFGKRGVTKILLINGALSDGQPYPITKVKPCNTLVDL